MKNLFTLTLALFASLLWATKSFANDRIVGGDMSLIPAYEQAGDKWLDADGNVIEDLILYVKQQGWNVIRVRLFVDPTQDSDPATCQDIDYVLALGKRVKDAGMKLMLDFHYSDTWADPGTQKIPASWSGDKSDSGLAKALYDYTYESITKLIKGGSTPDYVQIGNEITYGLLWNTTDGTYPTNSSSYASAGYCPSWSSNYSAGTTQWKRTAKLLNNAAHAIRQGFQEQGIDSTAVKLIVHTEMGGSQTNKDNFYKHIRTAGFDNYDIIGLSYYPFWNGDFTKLGSLLTTLKSDFAEKEVQIVETAWYNSYYPYTEDGTNQYTISSLSSNWTASGPGMVYYLKELAENLKQYSNVTGVLYWTPEECGNGYTKKVMTGYINRGMWKSSSGQKHTLLKANDGTTPLQALANYLTESSGTTEDVDAEKYFQNLGFESGDLTGWTCDQSWYTQWPKDLSSWANAKVYAGSYTLELWNATTDEGPVISQAATLPNGSYKITAKALAQQSGFYLFANDKTTSITANTAKTWEVSTNVTDGTLKFGIGSKSGSTAKYMYADDFTVTYMGAVTNEETNDSTATGDEEEEEVYESVDYTDSQGIVYSLWPTSKTANVKKGTDCIGSIVIPATLTVDGVEYTVNTIVENAFANNEQLERVVIGKNVYEIWGSAFSNCWKMEKVTFEEGSCLSTIAKWAFYSCAIDSIDIPEGVTVIPEGCFSNCWNLNYIALRGEVTDIGDFAFSKWAEEGCEQSFSPLDGGVWIYATETPTISNKAFNALDVAEDTLYVHYALVEDIAYTALGFAGILPLDTVDTNVYHIDEQGVKYILREDGTASVFGYAKGYGPNNVKNWDIAIPETITVDDEEYEVVGIENNAFANHKGLCSIKLPESLTYIGTWSFYGTSIKSIILYDGVTTIPEGAFSDCQNLTQIECYGEMEQIGDYAFSSWAESGCASSSAKVQYVVLWSKSVPSISDIAFHTQDIANSILFVEDNLVDNPAYQSLGFKEVRSLSDYLTAVDCVQANRATNKTYDLSGRPTLAKKVGVYILDGKKYIK